MTGSTSRVPGQIVSHGTTLKKEPIYREMTELRDTMKDENTLLKRELKDI